MIKKINLLICSFLLFIFSPLHSENSTISTLDEGKLIVGVTGICTDDSPHHNCWVYKILSNFAQENGLELDMRVVTFEKSWELAANNQLDIVATGITPLPHREVEGATNNSYYSIVKRGVRIHTEDAEKFSTIQDFVGFRVGAVNGMTSHLDLLKRAPEGVEIVATDTWGELYHLFESSQIQGVAEGFYVFPGDDEDINNYDNNTMMIDAHDLTPGQIEGNTFVVRDNSSGILDRLNQFIESSGLPWHKP